MKYLLKSLKYDAALNSKYTVPNTMAIVTTDVNIFPIKLKLVEARSYFVSSGNNSFFDIQKSTDGGSNYSSLGGGDGFGEKVDNAGFSPGALMTLNGAGTTNAINYKIFGKQSGGGTAKLGAGGYSVIMLLEVAA